MARLGAGETVRFVVLLVDSAEELAAAVPALS